MSTRQVQNVASLISTVDVLDGSAAVFPSWRSRVEDVLLMQNTLDIVNGTLVRPKEDTKADASVARTTDYTKGYNPKESAADWDSLSELASSTIRLRLSRPLALRYRKTRPASRLFTTIVNAYEKNTRARRIRLQEAFWESKHDPNTPIALWIGHIRVAADNLLTINELPTDRQIADRLVGGLDALWAAVKDSIVYTAQDMSLDDVIGALEAHEVSLNGKSPNNLASAASASAKRFACSNCGRRGHKSSDCRKPKTKAGNVSTVKLGGYDSGSFDDGDEVNVVYE